MLLILILFVIIGDFAFADCYALSKVILRSGLTILGITMFEMDGVPTQLGSVIIPSTITKIGEELLLP